MLGPVAAILLWDPKDLGTRTEEILLGPRDPGSDLSRLSWDLADHESFITMPPYFEQVLLPVQLNFAFGIPKLCAA